MKTDAELRQHVIDELNSEPALDINTVSVKVENGLITLSGRVSCLPKRGIAVRAAERVTGVRGVAQELAVALDYDNFVIDFELQEAVHCSLRWNSLFPENALYGEVEQGMVTLFGQVDHAYQKRAAEEVVRNLRGVRGVVDLIVVSSHTLPSSVEQEVRRMLGRTVDHATDGVHAQVANGVVILTGEVGSWSEREEAERAAMKLHGVNDVDNRIIICA